MCVFPLKCTHEKQSLKIIIVKIGNKAANCKTFVDKIPGILNTKVATLRSGDISDGIWVENVISRRRNNCSNWVSIALHDELLSSDRHSKNTDKFLIICIACSDVNEIIPSMS